METLKLKFTGQNGSMGLKTNSIYKVQCKIVKDYIILNINGIGVPYTLNDFMANWKTV